MLYYIWVTHLCVQNTDILTQSKFLTSTSGQKHNLPLWSPHRVQTGMVSYPYGLNNMGGKNLPVTSSKFFSFQHPFKHNSVCHQPELTVKQMHRVNNIVKSRHLQQYNIYTNTVLNPQTMYHQVLQALVEASSLSEVRRIPLWVHLKRQKAFMLCYTGALSSLTSSFNNFQRRHSNRPFIAANTFFCLAVSLLTSPARAPPHLLNSLST